MVSKQWPKSIVNFNPRPREGATAISAKNPLLFSAKINNFSNYKHYFTFYNLLFFVKYTSFVHFLWCESPGIFMSASCSPHTLSASIHFCHNMSFSINGHETRISPHFMVFAIVPVGAKRTSTGHSAPPRNSTLRDGRR